METKKFIVHKTGVYDMHGVKRRHGDVIELADPVFIRTLNKMGFLRPYIDEGDDAEDAERAKPSSPTIAGKARAKRAGQAD